MKVIQIAGFLGSGKTTTILSLARRFIEMGKKTAIIVNEIGEVPVDGRVLEELGLKIKEIGQGCICCELVTNLCLTLELLNESYNPDAIIIEPTGLAIPERVNKGVLLSKVKVDLSPTTVLFDISCAEEFLDERFLGHLVIRQLKDAEIIAINKVDLADENTIAKYESKIRSLNPSAKVIRMSALKNIGLDRLMSLLRCGG